MTHRIFYGIDFKLTDYETGQGFSNMESAVWIFVSGVPYL